MHVTGRSVLTLWQFYKHSYGKSPFAIICNRYIIYEWAIFHSYVEWPEADKNHTPWHSPAQRCLFSPAHRARWRRVDVRYFCAWDTDVPCLTHLEPGFPCWISGVSHLRSVWAIKKNGESWENHEKHDNPLRIRRFFFGNILTILDFESAQLAIMVRGWNMVQSTTAWRLTNLLQREGGPFRVFFFFIPEINNSGQGLIKGPVFLFLHAFQFSCG